MLTRTCFCLGYSPPKISWNKEILPRGIVPTGLHSCSVCAHLNTSSRAQSHSLSHTRARTALRSRTPRVMTASRRSHHSDSGSESEFDSESESELKLNAWDTEGGIQARGETNVGIRTSSNDISRLETMASQSASEGGEGVTDRSRVWRVTD